MAGFKALIILTSHSQLGLARRMTGFNLAELTHPLFELERANIRADIMSVRGGPAPLDENSHDLSDPINRDFMDRKTFLHQLQNTLSPAQVEIHKYSAVILAGGYGAFWDFAVQPDLARIILGIYEAGGIVGAINQGPLALINLTLQNGRPLIENKMITGMSDREIMDTGLAERFPLFVEAELRKKGGIYTSRDPWLKHVVIDKHLITGQNSASAQVVGEAVRYALVKKQTLGAEALQRGTV